VSELGRQPDAARGAGPVGERRWFWPGFWLGVALHVTLFWDVYVSIARCWRER
jgi:hypothetical protein